MVETTYSKAKREVEAVRRSGKTNMLDKGNVIEIAVQCGLYHLTEVLQGCTDEDYMALIQEASEEWRDCSDEELDELADRIRNTRVTREIR